ncbi:hypothetical protein [uncultured Granulicatella sp.]
MTNAIRDILHGDYNTGTVRTVSAVLFSRL